MTTEEKAEWEYCKILMGIIRDFTYLHQGRIRYVYDARKEKYVLRVWRETKADRKKCGANTRKGTPCQMQRVEGKKRCRLHGGLSTGAKTEAGREAIRESNRRRAKQVHPTNTL